MQGAGVWIARDPSSSAIIAIHSITVALAEIFASLPLVQISTAAVLVDRPHKNLRRHQKPTLVFAVAQGDTRVAAVGRTLPTIYVCLNHDLPSAPSFAVVATAVKDLRRLETSGEHHDVSRVFVDGHVCEFTPSDVLPAVPPVIRHVGIDFHALAYDDRFTPSLSAIFATFHINPTILSILLEDKHGTIHGHGQMPHYWHLLNPGFMKRFLFVKIVSNSCCQYCRTPSCDRQQHEHPLQISRTESVTVSHRHIL